MEWGCIDWQFDPVWPIKGAQIIQSRHMIRMGVGDQQRINLFDIKRQQLVSDIRPRIYEDRGLIRFHKHRTALTAIAGIVGVALSPAGAT